MAVNMMRSRLEQVIGNQSITDGVTVAGSLDCKDADWCTLIFDWSAQEGTDATDAVYDILMCDTTVVTDHVTIQATQAEPLTATAHLGRVEVDLNKYNKRYLRVKVTAGTGTGSNCNIGVHALLGRLDAEPSGTAGLVGNTTNYSVDIP